MNLMRILGIKEYKLCKKNDETYMSKQQKKHFKKILRAWKQHITNASTGAKENLHSNSNQFSDLNDRASHEEELLFLLRKQSREGKLVSRIEKTIRNIDEGNYGYCELCDSEIGIARLEVRPVAQLCIDCKSISEETEKTAV